MKMEETLQQQTKKPSKAVFKAIIFAAFIIGAIFLIRFTPVKNYLDSIIEKKSINNKIPLETNIPLFRM